MNPCGTHKRFMSRCADSRLMSWLPALLTAAAVAFVELLQTEIRDLPGLLRFELFRRTFRTLVLQPWYPGCGYYSYQDSFWWGIRTSWGPARWFWRRPKVSAWAWNQRFTLGT